MNSPTRAHLPSPRHILPLFLFSRTKKRRFGANSAPNLAKNSLFETKRMRKLQKKSHSSPFFHHFNSPNYPVWKPLFALFSGKNADNFQIMVNLLPIPLWPESSNSLFVPIFRRFLSPARPRLRFNLRHFSLPFLQTPSKVGIGQNPLARILKFPFCSHFSPFPPPPRQPRPNPQNSPQTPLPTTLKKIPVAFFAKMRYHFPRSPRLLDSRRPRATLSVHK